LYKFIFHITFVLGILLSGGNCIAQEKIFRNLKVYSQKQGFNSSNVHKIIQDKFGFLWIATQEGLNRFDGSDFTQYNKGLSPKRALLAKDIRDLIADTIHNIIWAICNEGGVNGIDVITGDVRYAIFYPDRSQIDRWRTCAVSRKEKIYIGNTLGMDVFNTATKQFEQVQPFKIPIDTTTAVRSINIDGEGNLWIGLRPHGLLIYDPARQATIGWMSAKTFNSQNSKNFWPKCIIFSNDSVCWLGTTFGLYKIAFDEKYNCQVSLVKSATGKSIGGEVNHIVVTGNELIIPHAGLARFSLSGQTLQEIHPVGKDFAHWLNDINYVFEDHEQNIWLGCMQGLAIMKNQPVPFVPVRNNGENKLGHVYAVCPISETQTLIGTDDGLILMSGGEFRTIYNKGRIQNLFRLTGNIIVVSGRTGVQIFTNHKLLPIDRVLPEFRDFASWQFNSIGHFDDTLAIIGTESFAGILLWNKKMHTVTSIRKSRELDNHSLSTDVVNTVYVDSKGQAIILSDYSLTVFDRKKRIFRPITYKDETTGLPMGIFFDMTETKDNYWVNVYGVGLLKLNKDFSKERIFGLGHGLSNTGVYEIFNYKDSLLLLTSNIGLTVFEIRTGKSKRYYEEDGLQNNTFEEACGDTLNGIFYTGGSNGFVTINPVLLESKVSVPSVYFNGLTLHKADLLLKDTSNLIAEAYEIANDVLQVTIYLTSMNFDDPDRITYAYRILEKDDEWISAGSSNSIPLVRMAPGKYHIEVKASNKDGVWSEPKQLKLTFLPKWFETTSFKLLVVFAVAALIYLAYRYRKMQLKKQHEIRKGIATDLHDNLGSTLNSVKIFANLAASGVQSEMHLRHVVDSIKLATTNLRDMLWVLDDSMDTIEDFVTRLNQYAVPVCAAVHIGINVKAEFDAQKKQLTKEEKQNLFLICKEAINNSIKYSQASRINVLIGNNGNKAVIAIEDDGVGFSMGQTVQGYGLKNMHYRARQVKYKVEINSEEGKGTSIKVVPYNQ
jgi:signal transduction histidine kinase/ligand-binding sensor domain-containing protein